MDYDKQKEFDWTSILCFSSDRVNISNLPTVILNFVFVEHKIFLNNFYELSSKTTAVSFKAILRF